MRVRVLVLSVLCLLPLSSAQADTIVIAAAANLAAVMNSKFVPAYAKISHDQIKVVIGATKVLEQQMENGAPYDVFVSADVSTVKKLAAEHLIDGSSVKPYAIGQLVMWTRKDAADHPATIADLTDTDIERIVVANPQTAPYGAATIDALTRANMLESIKPKIVYSENIQQSLQFASSGNADVSFTALSLVMGRTDGVYTVVPDFLHLPILQALGVKTGASHSARSFADFLTSDQADKIWTTSGYALPEH